MPPISLSRFLSSYVLKLFPRFPSGFLAEKPVPSLWEMRSSILLHCSQCCVQCSIFRA